MSRIKIDIDQVRDFTILVFLVLLLIGLVGSLLWLLWGYSGVVLPLKILGTTVVAVVFLAAAKG